MTLISITLDQNAENIICAGQCVTGHVHIEATKQIKMRGLRFELRGTGYVHWQRTETVHGHHGADPLQHTQTTRTISYKGSEMYVNFEIYLTGSRDNTDNLYLQPGTHDFPFSFVMPPAVPSSFESRTGHVRYTAKAIVDRRMRKDDTAEIILKVVRCLDLNMESRHLWEPISTFNYSPVVAGCCCVCISGSVDMNIRLNRGCFTPGETIGIDGELHNRSNNRVKYTTISLVQNVKYTANCGSRIGNFFEERNVIAEIQRPGFAAGETYRLGNVELQVPFLPPSRLDGCSIIDITYSIEIRTNFGSCDSYSCINCGIVIGNVPLRGFAQSPVVTSQPMPHNHLQPSPT